MSEAEGEKEEHKWKDKGHKMGKGQDQWVRTVERGQGHNLETEL